MRARKAGETVDVTITYLEMTAPPTFPRPPMPMGAPSALILAEQPPAWYFLSLYDAVGREYAWRDRHEDDEATLTEFVQDPDVGIFTLFRSGWLHGFFMLDWRVPGECDLSYFGLVREAIGQGLGKFLLRTALHTGWDREGVTRMTVNTCTLDHPRALANYQRHGFQPYRQHSYQRTLVHDWDPANFP